MVKAFLRNFFSFLRTNWHYAKLRLDNKTTHNERINKNYIRKFLPVKPIIIDAGAHEGSDSIEMSRLFSRSKVYAFEPVPFLFERLKEHTRRYSRISCYSIAFSNHTGEQVMHISSGASDGSSSFLEPKEHLVDHPDVFFNTDLLVQTKTLDDWAEQEKINHVDFLWLDMQGYEIEVLQASKKILPTVKAIHMEVSTRRTYEGVPIYSEVKAWMEAHGFTIQVEAIPEGWDMGNVLFVRKNGKSTNE